MCFAYIFSTLEHVTDVLLYGFFFFSFSFLQSLIFSGGLQSLLWLLITLYTATVSVTATVTHFSDILQGGGFVTQP